MLSAGRTIIERLSSTRLSIILFGLLAVAAIPGTLLKSQREYYSHPLFVILLIAFALHLTLCTVWRWRSLSRSTLIVHLGVLITLAGAVLTSTGYVATINIYEGESSKTVYRWDLKKDTPFTYEIRIKKINKLFYPVPLQIGVMKGEEKHVLKVLKTGESFQLDGYTVTADNFDPWKEVVSVAVSKGGQSLGSADTAGGSTLPPDFPFSFKLVAFQDAVIKRFWVDIDFLDNGHVVQSGTTEINTPFNWNGLDFFNTQISLDQERRPYAGIQIVNDPGKYLVYTGMFILSVGTIAAWYRRFKR
jgi:cytochrome c biogenesis protein ResB